MQIRDTASHKRDGLLADEGEDAARLRHDVEAIGWSLDKDEKEVTQYLVKLGLASHLERVGVTARIPAGNGATLIMAETIGGRGTAWVRRRTGDGWVVAYRLVAEGGRPAVAEVRLFPDEGDVAWGDGGAWSGDVDAVPPGGVPGRVVRAEVRVVDDVALVGVQLRKFRQHFGAFADAVGVTDLTGQLAASQAGVKRGRNDRRIAEVAAAYDEALEGHSKSPAKDAAQQLGLKVERVHEMMFKARERGLFSGGARGKAGGHLTPLGRALLAAEG